MHRIHSCAFRLLLVYAIENHFITGLYSSSLVQKKIMIYFLISILQIFRKKIELFQFCLDFVCYVQNLLLTILVVLITFDKFCVAEILLLPSGCH